MTNIMWFCLHVESKKWYKWTYVQNRNKFMDKKQTYGYQREKKGEE